MSPAAAASLGLLGAYLIGSIPFGLLVARRRGRDPRLVGSGNIGATNVVRAAGRMAGAATLLADTAKGALGFLLARALGPEPVAGHALAVASLYLGAALIAPVAGHCFPPWLRFRGGKGVATALGVLLAAWWPAAVAGLLVWLLVLGVTRRVSLASLGAAAAVPLATAASAGARGTYLPGAIVLGALVIARHRSNVARLLAGREPPLGARPDDGGGGP